MFSLVSVLAVCKVLVKCVEETHVNYDLEVPRNVKNDTTLANNVFYVKYDDYSFYPEFIVRYTEYPEKYFRQDYADYVVDKYSDYLEDYED